MAVTTVIRIPQITNRHKTNAHLFNSLSARKPKPRKQITFYTGIFFKFDFLQPKIK